MRALGKSLQVAALLVLPIGLVILRDQPILLFASLGFGVSLFLIGRILEGFGSSDTPSA
jgi:hypothetical protein